MIVFGLAAAFELELWERILKPLCDSLISLGVRNYPVPEGHGYWNGWPDLPILLEDGQISRKLTLGGIERLLRQHFRYINAFFTNSERDLERARAVLPEITKRRNDAVHSFKPSMREEAEDIRRRWLGIDDPKTNIFTALLPRSAALRRTAGDGPH